MNAELLLMFTLECDRAYLYAHPERKLSADEQGRYDQALAERERGMPAQYITGHQEFWGMDFIVTPAVLIPRPETEHVVETVLQMWDGRPRLPGLVRIVDVGTGSGCIALALAKELPQAEIHATEISPAALEIARANAARLQLQDRVRLSSNRSAARDWRRARSILLSRIRPMWANRRKTRCNSKSANMNRATRFLPAPQAWK